MNILNLSLAILFTLTGITACSPSSENTGSDTKTLPSNSSQEDSGSKNNQPPRLTLASASSTIFFEQERIQFSVKAKDDDGVISKVVFFMDGNKLLEKTSPPYTLDWIAIYGNHEITITAFDNFDVASASISKTINIVKKQDSNYSPTVSIVSPLNNDNINEGDTLYFEAIPEDTDGTIDSVTFYLNGQLYKTLTLPPYKTAWVATLGKHHLSVNAIDDRGFSGSVKQVSIDVTTKTQENLVPIINLLSPQLNAAFFTEDIITIEKVDQANRSIDVKITRAEPKPTRNAPSITAGMKDCEWEGQCQVKQNGQMTTKIYQAGITDLGFGSNFNKPWKYSLIGLPAGITHTDTGIKRQYSSNPNYYSYNPHTFITFSASASVQPGTYNFTFRLEHPKTQRFIRIYPK